LFVFLSQVLKPLYVLIGEDMIMLSAGATTELPSAAVSRSYRCLPMQTMNLTGNGMLTVSQLQLQAFHEAGDTKFGAGK
jgi:hypothetical protein